MSDGGAAHQLPLELECRPALGRDDFIVTDANARALEEIGRLGRGGGGQLLLSGPGGSGKTHLVEVWRHETEARKIEASTLREGDVPGYLSEGALAVEDIDRLERSREPGLFHLLNLAREQKVTLLLTSAKPGGALAVALPDLASRLQALPAVRLGAPDDALLTAVAAKLFADRQLPVAPEVIAYLVRRSERSVAALQRTVAVLDGRALAERRAVTVPLARAVLEGRAS